MRIETERTAGMAIKVTKDGDVVVFTLEGTIDGKAAIEAEKAGVYA